MALYVPHHRPPRVDARPPAGIGPAAPPADLVPPARTLHPAVSPAELDLLVGWYTWSWQVYREVRRRIASGVDSVEADDLIPWLATFTAASAHACLDPADPGDPLRRGLAELWPRTVASRSTAWADRFAQALANRYRALARQCRDAAPGEFLDPIAYLRQQRAAGGGEVAAHLVEHALGIDVSTDPACAGQAASLTEAFADVLGLRQALGRGVRPPLRPSPRHAELLTRLLDSRLRHFARIAQAPSRAPHDTDGPRRGRAACHRYAEGLRVFLAADARWRGRHEPPPPAPSGRGRSVRPLGPAAFGPFTVPEFLMPYPERVNPHLHATAEHTRAWARRMGLFTGGLAPGAPPAWSESRYDALDFPLFTAMTHPQASRDELDLITDWYVWGFHFDDLIAKAFKHGHDPDGAHCWIDRVTSLLASPTRDFRPRNCVERGLADLFPRSARALARPLREGFYRATLDMVNSWAWELANAEHRRVPDPIEYIEARRRTGGGEFFVTLARYAGGDAVPTALLETEHLRGIAEAVIDSALLRNDIFSYHQEIAYEGELANSLVIAQHTFGYDLQTAVDHVDELVSRRLRTFASLTDRLPTTLDAADATDATREGVAAYVDALKAFMAGDLGWSLRTARHAEAGTPVAQRTSRTGRAVVSDRRRCADGARAGRRPPSP
ncbi:bifunctional terpene synthase/polyprenyl synthetase family protein [Streptomyces sp. NPDC048506]|uniref:bifunctional terpene synthase/polyprenyl synthetase family protein n=1 Tax=Streptomyces sp. NPDC048506 TaxID=3155028 RepID=UPI003440AC78